MAKDAVAEDDAYQREAVAVRKLQQTKSKEKHSPKKLEKQKKRGKDPDSKNGIPSSQYLRSMDLNVW